MILSASWDGRDLVSYIPHGYVISGSFTYAGGFLGGLSNYNKLTLSGSVYRGIHKFVTEEDERGKDLILGFSSEVDFMFKQYWKIDNKYDWYDPTRGATKYEMLYLDGMNIGRGFNVVYDQAFLWHNQIDLTYPLVEDILSLEGFVSATGVQTDLNKVNGLDSINWYLAAGAGIKMEIPGFPLGLYLVKNAKIVDDNNMKWKWQSGSLFSNNREGSGMSLVLAITTSIY
ncbi:MAG: hypothetical protein KBS81_00260 [Spirochaetales bacterium]|nr:hypothetical protein [Candidatus Physcosoma equi]